MTAKRAAAGITSNRHEANGTLRHRHSLISELAVNEVLLAFSVPKILKKKHVFESQRYLRERDHEAGRIACRRRTHHGRNDGRSDRSWLFLSYTYFSPRPSSGGNLFDPRPRRIAFTSPSSARPPPCSCGGATWACYLENPLFVAATTGHLSLGACGEVKCPVVAADSCTLPTNRDPAACGVSPALRRRLSSTSAYL